MREKLEQPEASVHSHLLAAYLICPLSPMKANLLEALTQVQDFRAPRGRRYPLWLLLLLVIMGTISGCLGYRALEDFACRHHDALVASLRLPPTRFPSDSTFRRVMRGIDFTDLAKAFNNWANDWMPTQEQDGLGVDGKSIKATLSNYDKAKLIKTLSMLFPFSIPVVE
jgi:hypothetical protein